MTSMSRRNSPELRQAPNRYDTGVAIGAGKPRNPPKSRGQDLGTDPAMYICMTTTQQLSELYKVLGELHKAGNDEGYNLVWDKIFRDYEVPMVARK